MRNVAAGNLDPLRTRRRPGRVCVSLRFVFQHFTVHSTHHVWTHIPIDLGIAFDSIVYVFICRPASKKVDPYTSLACVWILFSSETGFQKSYVSISFWWLYEEFHARYPFRCPLAHYLKLLTPSGMPSALFLCYFANAWHPFWTRLDFRQSVCSTVSRCSTAWRFVGGVPTRIRRSCTAAKLSL